MAKRMGKSTKASSIVASFMEKASSTTRSYRFTKEILRTISNMEKESSCTMRTAIYGTLKTRFYSQDSEIFLI